MKKVLFTALALASVLSCQTNSDDVFHGAKWIGTSESVVYSDFLPQFSISADIAFDAGSSRASLLFGGNDPRLMDRNLNIMGVENGKDESFVRLELDTEASCINVYRTGYTLADADGVVFRSLPLADSLIHDGKYVLSADVALSEITVSLDGVRLGTVNVGPLGHGGDYIVYPQLSDVGCMAEEGQSAVVGPVEVRDLREPKALLYSAAARRVSGQKLLEDTDRGGMPMLRSSFKVKGKPVRTATLIATARGIYELFINGDRAGSGELAPGLSQYNKHHYYQTYDVTGMLKSGRNEIRANLAEGWWSGDLTYGSGNHNYFGDQLSLLACLEIEYADGSKTVVVTDPKTWESSVDGPVVYASMFQGEVFDARRTIGNAKWKKAEEMSLEGHMSSATFGATAPRVDDYSAFELLPQPDADVTCVEVLSAQSVSEVRPGVFLYDMGQNMAGMPSISFSGLKEGQQVRMRYAEVLYPDLPEYEANTGMVMLENIRGAMAQDIYIASGAGEELFEPRQTLHGYRYLEITGMDRPLALSAVRGRVVSSVQDFTAHYETSNPLVNRLWENIRWSMRGNFISIPTDCPQRNERMGWSGDLSVFSRTSTYLSDVDDFLRRHMQAIRDVQMPDGRMPDVAPVGGAFGGLLWGSAGITVPYECYMQYADTLILEENYEAMARYMELVSDKYVEKESGLMTQGNRMFGGLGDWLGPQNSQIDNTAIWDAYYMFDLQIMQKAATVLGKAEDAAVYGKRLAERKKHFADLYFNAAGKFVASDYPRGNIMGGGRMVSGKGDVIDVQSSYVLPIAFGLIDDPVLRKKVEDNLVASLQRKSVSDDGAVCPPYSLMTGFITTAWISKALSMSGRSDVAYRLLQQTSYPSWLYPVTQGATTIWERLNSYTHENGFGGNNSMNSFNHYSFGAVGQWMIANSLGIDRDENVPGFRHFILHPEVDPTGQMSFARGWYDCRYGRISSEWKRVGQGYEYRFTIPEGTSATVVLPGRPAEELGPGEYVR